MTLSTLLMLGSALVVVLLALRAVQAWRSEEKADRGTKPGTGYTTLESHYISGGGGGGQSTTYHIPKDPQDYARLFVPKDRSNENDR